MQENVDTNESHVTDLEDIQVAYEKLKRLNALGEEELGRVEAVHENLRSQLEELERLNQDIYYPEIEKLQIELLAVQDDLSYCTKEVEQSEIISSALQKDLLDIQENWSALQTEKDENLRELESLKEGPSITQKDSDRIKKEIKLLEEELKNIIEKNKSVEKIISENTLLADRDKAKLLSINQTLERSLHVNEEKKEKLICLQRKLDMAKLYRGEIITSTLQLELAIKDVDNSIISAERAESLLRKEMDTSKRILERKKGAFNTNICMIPHMTEKIADCERNLRLQNVCNQKVAKEIDLIKRVTRHKIHIISQQDQNQHQLGNRLEKILESVDNLEMQISVATVENKKLDKFLSLLSAHLEVLTRNVASLTETESEANEQTKIKSHVISDLKCTLQGYSKRLRDLSNLQSILNNEKDTLVGARSASSEKISKMEKEIAGAKLELEVVLTNYNHKSNILSKHRESLINGRILRAGLQAEKAKCTLELQQKKEDLKRHHKQLENLQLTLAGLQRENALQKRRNLNLSDSKEAVSRKLGEIIIEIYRSNQKAHLHDHHSTELALSIRQRKEDVRLLLLKESNLLHSISSRKKIMIDGSNLDARISRLQIELHQELADKEKIRIQIEDTTDVDRWRELSTDAVKDPDEQEVHNKILLVERKVDEHRGKLFERTMTRDDIDWQICEAKTELSKKLNIAKPLLEYLNRLKSDARLTTRRIMVAISELGMYQILCMKLESERDNLNKALKAVGE